ncbi:MAG: hypothetical protein OQK01_12000 [Xanthomonadales bacterium]|jgi:hypothetical protein|nr:hypothetical protein [Xanthomonadales bacterium]
MGAFRILLLLLFACILGYTAIVIAHHGIGLLGVFFGDIAAMGWPGQFNVDFMSFLTLSALWLSWRHHFSPLGIVLGMMGFFGGGLFLSAYLFLASFSAGGDMKVLLLGKYRAMG